MQRMIMIPVEQYDRMVESYDKAMEELREAKAQLKAVNIMDTDDVAHELKLYSLMDDLGCGRDEAELLLQDAEEAVARSQQEEATAW